MSDMRSGGSEGSGGSESSGGSRVMSLLRLLGADGHLDDSPQLRQALGGLTLPPPPECVAVSPSPTSSAGWSTLLVLLFLHKAEESQRSLWGLAAAKAARFVYPHHRLERGAGRRWGGGFNSSLSFSCSSYWRWHFSEFCT